MYQLFVEIFGELTQQIARSDAGQPQVFLSGAAASASRLSGFDVPQISSDAYLAIFNEVGSEKIIEIQSLKWLPDYPTISSTIFPVVRMVVPSSVVQRKPAQITALDSDNSAFPADVFVGECWGPSLPTSEPVMRSSLVTRNTRLLDTQIFVTPGFGSIASPSQFFKARSSSQRFTLRPGERVGLSVENVNTSIAYAVPMDVTGTITISGESYAFRAFCGRTAQDLTVNPWALVFAIENNTISDVVEVNDLHFCLPIAMALSNTGMQIIPYITVEPIIGLNEGSQVSAVKLDSDADDIPSGIILRQECQVTQHTPDRRPSPGWCSRELLAWWKHTRLSRTAGGTSNTTNNLSSVAVPLLDQKDGFRVRLHEGEGIAVFNKNDPFLREQSNTQINHMFNPMTIEAQIKLIDNPSAPSGGGEFTTISF